MCPGNPLSWPMHRQMTNQVAVCPENDTMSTFTIASCGEIMSDVTYLQFMKESIQETHSKVSKVVLKLHNKVLRGFQCFFSPIISESQVGT